MNQKKINKKEIAELMKISLSGSARDILRRLKAIDKGYRETTGEPSSGIKNLAIW